MTKKIKFPSIKDVAALVRHVKEDVPYKSDPSAEDYIDRFSGAEAPSIDLTIGFDPEDNSWSFQTGDNSYTGGAYGYPLVGGNVDLQDGQFRHRSKRPHQPIRGIDMELNPLIQGIEFPKQLTKDVIVLMRSLGDYVNIDLTAVVVAALLNNKLGYGTSLDNIDTLMEELAIIRENIRNGPPKT